MLNLRDKNLFKGQLKAPKKCPSLIFHLSIGFCFGSVVAVIFCITMAIFYFSNPDLGDSGLNCYASPDSDVPEFLPPNTDTRILY